MEKIEYRKRKQNIPTSLFVALLFHILSCSSPDFTITIHEWESSNEILYKTFEKRLKEQAQNDTLNIDFSDPKVKIYIKELVNSISFSKNTKEKSDSNYSITIPEEKINSQIQKTRNKIFKRYEEDITYKLALKEAIEHDSSALEIIKQDRETNSASHYPHPDTIRGRKTDSFREQIQRIEKIENPPKEPDFRDFLTPQPKENSPKLPQGPVDENGGLW